MVQRATLSLAQSWVHGRRWKGITRPYTAEDVLRFRGTLLPSYTIGARGCETFWRLLTDEPFVRSLEASTSRQAVDLVRAGLKSVFVGGGNGETSVGGIDPILEALHSTRIIRTVRSINAAFRWSDQTQAWSGRNETSWFVPVIADVHTGVGEMMDLFATVQGLIDAGAAGLQVSDREPVRAYDPATHREVLSPTTEVMHRLVAARLASDILGVGVVLLSRTHARRARCIRGDRDPIDQAYIMGRQNDDGTHAVNGGLDMAIARALVLAPYSDLVSFEPATADLGEAKEFAQAIHAVYPGKFLSYHCDPTLFRTGEMADDALLQFQNRLALLGYKFMYVTWTGIRQPNAGLQELASEYIRHGMGAFAGLTGQNSDVRNGSMRSTDRSDASVGATYLEAIKKTISTADVVRLQPDDMTKVATSDVSEDGKTR